MDSTDEFESYSVYIVTVQSIIIKFLTEAIKDILPDTNIEVSKDGIRILSMDPTHTTLVHMNLGATNFEKFHLYSSANNWCKHDKFIQIDKNDNE